MKSGYKTTEFYTTILGNAVALVFAVTGRDFSAFVPVVAVACALVANAVYAHGRNVLKAASLQADAAALAAAVAATPAVPPAVAEAAAVVAAVAEPAPAVAAPAPEAPAAPAPAPAPAPTA